MLVPIFLMANASSAVETVSLAMVDLLNVSLAPPVCSWKARDVCLSVPQATRMRALDRVCLALLHLVWSALDQESLLAQDVKWDSF